MCVFNYPLKQVQHIVVAIKNSHDKARAERGTLIGNQMHRVIYSTERVSTGNAKDVLQISSKLKKYIIFLLPFSIDHGFVKSIQLLFSFY